MTRWGYDEPNGCIVGKCLVQWTLYYEGRPQSETRYAETEEEAIAAGNALARKLRDDYADVGLFRNNAFEVRIY